MELFSIKRYAGDLKGRTEQTEKDILEELLKKVEKRKRKKDVQESNVEKDDSTQKVETHLKVDRALLEINEHVEEHVEQETNEVEAELTPAEAGFEVLGEDPELTKRRKVDMVLPAWLAYPTIIASSIPTAVDDHTSDNDVASLPYLTTQTRQALKELNIQQLFPVQSAVIPWILDVQNKPPPFRPRDICVSAPTGSGKTLAFAIPIVQILTQRVQPKIRALVVLPVTELALQVYKVFKKLCDKTDLTVCLLSKQTPFPVEQNKLVELYKGAYYSKVDIVVTTPGRLVEHLHSTKGFCLKALRFLVIDEADRIMDAVFQNWLYHIDSQVRETSDQLLSSRAAPLCYYELLQTASKQPHKLLFSATLSQDPEKLQDLRLFQPKLFTSVRPSVRELATSELANEQHTQEKLEGEFIGKYTTPAKLIEKYCITEARLKPLTLFSLINENGWKKFLCFTNSTDASGRLTFVLNQLLGSSESAMIVEELTATLQPAQRKITLSKFSRGLINGLVCSDALARGIDVPDVDIVVSYDPPRHIKTYIHRIGRTARAGRAGTAITLLTQKDQKTFNHTLAEGGKIITEEINVASDAEERYANNYAAALNALRRQLETVRSKKLIMKKRDVEKSIAHKTPAELTLMEKLQLNASTQIRTKLAAKPKIDPKRKQAEKQRALLKTRKFNVNAGKHKQIEK